MVKCAPTYYFAIFFLISIVVHAQDSTFNDWNYSLDEISISANKLNLSKKEISTKVEILDSKRINAANGTRLPDLLKSTPSAFIKAYGPTPTLQTISINGLGAEHTLILMDGIRLNSFQNSHIDLSIIPKEDIERIEIVNNGISSIYGSDAMGGVVNIISKNRRNQNEKQLTSINASITEGSFDTRKYSVGLYQQYNDFNTRVYFNSDRSQGNYEYYYDTGISKEIKTRENSAYSLYDVGINTQYLLDENNVIRVISSYTDQNKEVPGIETGTPSPLTKQYDKNWNNIIIVENNFSSLSNLKSSFNYQNNYMNYTVDPYLNSYYKNIVYSVASEINFGEEGYGFTSGINYSHANLQSNEVEPGTMRNQPAVFVSSFVQLSENIKVFPSLRYDYISDIQSGALTYRLGLNYQPFKNIDLSLKGNLGKNFRAPSFNDLYWKTSGNTELQPEESFNAEVGLLYSVMYFFNISFETTFNYIDANNKIVWTPQASGYWMPNNIAESISKNYALDLSLSKNINTDFSYRFGGGVQFIDSRKTSESFSGDPSKDKYFPYIPLQSTRINFGFNYQIIELNLFYSRIGERYSDFTNNVSMPSYTTLDGNIAVGINIFKISSKLRLDINNLFNVDYQVIAGYPMPLRNYQLTFSIQY